jgi:hypothetical protein
MTALPWAVVALASVISGVAVGTVFGFGLASHKQVAAGFRPRHANRFVRWLARPTREFGPADLALFLLLMAGWLIMFFVLCAIPVVAAAHFAEPDTPMVKFAVFAFAGVAYFSRRIGATLWQRCAA